MLKVAVTGGIGSGKSIVCSVFEKLGIPVYYADKAAKRLMDSDIEIRKKMINSFGMDIFDVDYKLNRTKFASIIFNNAEALSIINGIVHPDVRKEFNIWMSQQSAPYVIQEAAIVFESGLSDIFDKIITLSAPVEVRIDRVMKRDNITRERVLERIKNQMDEDLKIKLSDFIIVNDGKEMLLPQILNIHKNLQ
jgi:dephospho-CoA kinase